MSSRTDGLPLAGRTVVVTRGWGQAADLRRRLEMAGATVLVAPAIDFAPVEDSAALDSVTRSIGDYDGIIFTSANAVAAIFDRMAALSVRVECLGGLLVAAVGSATTTALRHRGVSPSVEPRHFTGADLADALGDVTGWRLLLPRSDVARADLPGALRRAGASVTEVVAYRTVADPTAGNLAHLLAERRVDAITFASPSAVRAALDALRTAGSPALRTGCPPLIIAVGPVTAAAVSALGLAVAAVAERHDAEGLMNAVVGAFAAARPGEQVTRRLDA